MSVVGQIGPCSVCRRPAKLEHFGCGDCVTRFGKRFVEIAGRVRRDPRFRSICFDAITEASHRALFVQYFGEPEQHPPPAARGPLER